MAPFVPGIHPAPHLPGNLPAQFSDEHLLPVCHLIQASPVASFLHRTRNRSRRHRLKQTHRLTCNAFTTADKPQLLAGRRFYTHAAGRNTQILRDIQAHRLDMRRHFWRLGDDRSVDIKNAEAFLRYSGHDPTQQITAVRTGPFSTGVREQVTDIAKGNRPQKGIRQSMQQYITIRMGFQTLAVRNRDTAKNNSIACAEGMNIKALTNSHNLLRESPDNSEPTENKAGKIQVSGYSNLNVVRPSFNQNLSLIHI